jgi:hypothetical protein
MANFGPELVWFVQFRQISLAQGIGIQAKRRYTEGQENPCRPSHRIYRHIGQPAFPLACGPSFSSDSAIRTSFTNSAR